jgi:tetratricopeptide (TPR) repeat protein
MLGGEAGPLSAAAARDMVTPRQENYGLGLVVEQKGAAKYFTHGGSDEGFQSLLYAHETKGYGVALMTNSDSGFRLMPEILRAVGAAYGWDGFQVEPLRRASVAAETLDRLAGRYRIESDSALAVARSGGDLSARPTLSEGFTLIPVSPDTFVRRDEETRYQFRDGSLEIRENGKTRTATRLKADEHLPGEDLETGRIDAAVAGYRRLRAANPDDPAVSEVRLNGLGYTLLQAGRKADSLAVFRLNTEFYPRSANPWDSLAEATEAAGDAAGAIELYRKALALANGPGPHGPNDGTVSSHASGRLAVLGASSPQ